MHASHTGRRECGLFHRYVPLRWLRQSLQVVAAYLTVLVPHAGLQAGADVGVGPHVHGLLLGPHELSIWVPPQLPLYQVKGEGRQLQPQHDISQIQASSLNSYTNILHGMSASHDVTNVSPSAVT